jgi:hypothetical protein
VITHDCINQIRLSIMGPGPHTGSPNFNSPSASYEVGLIDQPRTVQSTCVSGTQTFVFDDDGFVDSKDCCRPTYTNYNNGNVGPDVSNFLTPTNVTYRPNGKLGEFVGASPSALWTLVVQDMQADNYKGAVLSWDIDFQLQPCVPKYIWTNLTLASSSVRPPPLYQSHSIVYSSSLFIFGGRDKNDVYSPLLYRFDTTAVAWTQLAPVGFHAALDFSSAIGANFMLTPFGLLRYGGLKRQSDFTGQYVNEVFLQDPVTQHWRRIPVSTTPFSVPTRQKAPTGRYLAAGMYISSNDINWRTQYSYRILYDQFLPSIHSNYANSLIDSILLFGGFDGSTGSVFDGSSGGLLNDAWMIRLTNFSVPRVRETTNAYLQSNCAWRGNSTGTMTCLKSQSSSCSLRDLVLLAWCGGYFQNI